MSVVNLNQQFEQIREYWQPVIAGALNGQHVKLARIKGEFVWHQHADADELFFVVSGTLVIRMHNGEVTIRPGEFYIVPKGVEHQPVAAEEVWIMLFEPAGTLNTGNVINSRTVYQPRNI